MLLLKVSGGKLAILLLHKLTELSSWELLRKQHSAFSSRK